MKKLFNTPKKAVISIICLVVIAVVVIAAISAIVIRNSLISKTEAGEIALRDAGVDESEASALRARLDFDDRRFQYEVDFYNNGTEYEYVILAKNGDIISRNIEGGGNGNDSGKNVSSNPKDQTDSISQENQTDSINPEDQTDSSKQESQTDASAAEQNQNVQVSNQPASGMADSAQPQEISLDEAKAAALADANLSEADVTFTKAKFDDSENTKVYDIEFYTSDMKYDYEINAYDGTVQKKENEVFSVGSEGSAGNTGNAGNTDNEGNVSNAGNAGNAGNTGNTGNNYIGVDRAKEIALNHANLSETDVQFIKAKLENDDGKVEYEIEFYFNGMEYDYTVDAVSGNILEYDVDFD